MKVQFRNQVIKSRFDVIVDGERVGEVRREAEGWWQASICGIRAGHSTRQLAVADALEWTTRYGPGR